MSDIDLGEVQARFGFDLSSLQAQTQRAAEMVKDMSINIKSAVSGGSGAFNDSLDITQGMNKMQDQIKSIKETVSDNFSNMTRVADDNLSKITKSGSDSFGKMKSSAGKDIQGMVDNINTKMQQAQAAQLRMQALMSKKATVQLNNPADALKFDSQIASAEAQMNRYQTMAQQLARNMRGEFDTIPASLSKIAGAMDKNEGQINSLQAKMKALQSTYKGQLTSVSGDFEHGFKMGESKDSLKTKAEIDKLRDSMNKLIAENDALNGSYAKAEDRSENLKKALSGVNTKLNEQARDAKLASAAMANSAGGGGGGRGRNPNNNSNNDSGGFWNQIKGTTNKVSGVFDDMGTRVGRVSSLFHQSSKGMADDAGLITRGITSLNRNMRMVGSSIIFFQLLSGAITNTAGFMLDAAKTNSRFSSSLNLIKVNLMTAFYPIYTAVMPALNTLMAGLAKVTGYVAGFIATLFGTTYHAARQGAQGLYSQMQVMKDTSKSAKAGLDDTADGAKKIADSADDATKKAKELKNALMGFDEINLLNQDSGNADDKIKTPKAPSSKKGDDGGDSLDPPGIDFGSAPDMAMPKWLTDFANNVKRIAAELFAPIKEAWDKVGHLVMEAWKYALGEVWRLIKDIGKSFLEVWTNGTGEKFVEGLLILLADMLNIVGDIARAFAEAWEENNRGTRLIQSIFDLLISVEKTLHEIAKSFREAWNDGTGKKIAADLLDLFTDIFKVLKSISDAFRTAWTNDGNGTKLISSILHMFDEILVLLGKITTAWTNAWNTGVGVSIIEHILHIITNINNTIGALAKNFGNAWDKASVGQKIFEDIDGLADIILGTLDDMTGATVNWAKSLDFTPLLQSIHNLLKSMQPFTKNIGDGLKFLYEQVLLPLGKFTIEKVIPDFLDLLAASIKVVNAIIDALKPLGKWFFDSFLKPLAGFSGGSFHSVMQGIIDILNKFTDWIKSHQKLVEGITAALVALFAFRVATSTFEKGTGLVSKLVDSAVQLSGKEHLLKNFFEGITGIDKFKEGVSQLKNMWSIVNENWSASKMGQWFQTGPLGGAMQSMKSAGGFGGLSTAGKVGTGLAGAGVALGAGWDIVSAIKEKNPTKKFEDFGSGAGTAIGGGLGLFFGGPLGAAIGSQIGGTVGKWAGDAAKKFTDGWNKAGSTKRPSDWLEGLGWDAAKWWKSTSKSLDDFSKNFQGWVNGIKKWLSQHWLEVAATIINPIAGLATWFLKDTKTGQSIVTWAKSFPGKAANWAKDVGKNIGNFIDSGKKWVKDAGNNIGKWVSEHQTATNKTIGKWANGIGSIVHTSVEGAKSLAVKAGTKVGGWFSDFRSGTGKTVSKWAGTIGDLINGGSNNSKSKVIQVGKNIGSWITGFMSGTGKNLRNWAGSLGDVIGKGLSSGANTVKRGAAGIANGIVGVIGGAVNGVIKGVNWVLSKVGAGSHTLGTWSVPRFATGGYHKGGLALVNDAPGENYQEMYRLPNGQHGMFPKRRNLLVNLEAGSQVLDGNTTAAMVPHYAGGIFGGDFLKGMDFSHLFDGFSDTVSTVGKVAKDVWEEVQDFSSGVWSFVSHPFDLIMQGINQFFSKGSLGGIAGSVVDGAADMIGHGAVDMVKNFIKQNAPKKKVKKGSSNSSSDGGMFDFDFDFSSLSNLFGFADGGFVNKDGLYRMGENNLQEMVVPLTKPARAVELMREGLKVMNLSGMELAAPDVVTNNFESSMTSSASSNNTTSTSEISGSSTDMKSAIRQAIIEASEELKRTNPDADEKQLNMNIDGDVFASIMVKVLNRHFAKVGFNPLNI